MKKSKVVVVALTAALLVSATFSLALADHGGSHVPPDKVKGPGVSCNTPGEQGIFVANGRDGNVICDSGVYHSS